jgi:uncharacterized protein (TIGR03435 family)
MSLQNRWHSRAAAVLSILLGLLAAAPCAATAQTASPLSYDVASIKPSKAPEGSTLLFRLGAFTAKGLTLKSLLRGAYGIEDDQISGAPKWVGSQTYDIEAKVDGADAATLEKLSEDQAKLMFQSFLRDRFQLKVHWETKQLPILALVVAKGGPKLQQAKPGDTYPDGIKGPDGKAEGHAGMMMWGTGRLTGQGIPIGNLVSPLTQELGRIVQDKTGLTGNYDIELRWTTDDAAPDSRSASDSPGPSIFTAMQEQLGLKLESQRAPVQVLVIDHVEQPPPN